MKVNTPLWQHQTGSVDTICRAFSMGHNLLLRAGMASGKTLTIYKLIERQKYQNILIVTKKAAIRSAWWQDNIKHLTNAHVITLDTGNSREKAAIMQQERGIFVVNYETALLMAPTIAKTHFDLIVADESHYLQAYNSKTSLALAEACYSASHRVAMTGTAWNDKPTSLYGQMRWLHPELKSRGYHQSKILGSYTDFFEKYAIYYMLNNIKIPTGYKNLDKLAQEVAPYIHNIRTEDVIDLPPVRHEYLTVPMPAEYRRIYNELRQDMLARIEQDEMSADNVLVESLRLHQLTGGYYKPDDGAITHFKTRSPKLDTLIDLLDSIGHEPVVVFTRFKDDVKLIADAIKDRPVLRLTGDQHDEYKFQYECSGNEVLLANIGAGAEGVNLSRAGYAIYYSTGYSNTQYEQSLWRIRRPGRDLSIPVVYYHIAMEGSIDIDIQEALKNKQEISATLLKEVLLEFNSHL